MKPFQQRRLFFQAATSKTDVSKEVGHHVLNTCFRPCGWIAVILAALLFGCASLTPDRVNVIAGIAGQAAAEGAAEWLAKHPEHRPAFQSVIDALSAVHRNGNTNEQALENAFVEQMSSLPVSALSGQDGELYVSGDSIKPGIGSGGLLVWDAHLKKTVPVTGKATRPVLKATLIGLKRAMVPKPPAPVVARARRVDDLEWRAAEGPGSMKGGPTLTTNLFLHQQTLLVASTFDVTLNEHGVQQVNVRWVMAPNALYTVQRKEDKDWEGYSYAQNTNTVATPWVWTTLWPAPVAVGTWRVVRQ